MADLALSDTLIDEYLKYKFQYKYRQDIVRKLFKYIQPFAIREDYISDPSMANQIESDPMIEIVESCSDGELVQNTLLKFMITDEPISADYKTINLNNSFEKLKPKYGAMYQNSRGKDRAIEHIKFLLSDAKWIKITDGYIATSTQWDSNKRLIANIVPNISIDLTIIGADRSRDENSLDISKRDQIEEMIPNLNKVKSSVLSTNRHDRYIETDRLNILLSSGLEHLNSNSNRDFTYIVEIKN